MRDRCSCLILILVQYVLYSVHVFRCPAMRAATPRRPTPCAPVRCREMQGGSAALGPPWVAAAVGPFR